MIKHVGGGLVAALRNRAEWLRQRDVIEHNATDRPVIWLQLPVDQCRAMQRELIEAADALDAKVPA